MFLHIQYPRSRERYQRLVCIGLKCERFMKTLKREEVHASGYRDITDARARIGTFIEQVYNRQRLHSALDYLPPVEYEENLVRLGGVIPPRQAEPATCWPLFFCLTPGVHFTAGSCGGSQARDGRD
jgi:Integrase core domain